MTRVYLPLTLELLRTGHEAGSWPASADRFVAPDDTEDGEYAALMAAADASRAMLAGPGRRVVVVAEVDDADGPVPLADVVAVHVDERDDAADDDDLGWWATQEIPDLLN